MVNSMVVSHMFSQIGDDSREDEVPLQDGLEGRLQHDLADPGIGFGDLVLRRRLQQLLTVVLLGPERPGPLQEVVDHLWDCSYFVIQKYQ